MKNVVNYFTFLIIFILVSPVYADENDCSNLEGKYTSPIGVGQIWVNTRTQEVLAIANGELFLGKCIRKDFVTVNSNFGVLNGQYNDATKKITWIVIDSLYWKRAPDS